MPEDLLLPKKGQLAYVYHVYSICPLWAFAKHAEPWRHKQTVIKATELEGTPETQT